MVKSTLIRILQQELGLLLVTSLFEVLIRQENLSKYVFVLSFEKYGPKLQKIIETKSHKVKKVAKSDEISPFEGQNGIKTTKLMESYALDMLYSGITQVLPIM